MPQNILFTLFLIQIFLFSSLSVASLHCGSLFKRRSPPLSPQEVIAHLEIKTERMYEELGIIQTTNPSKFPGQSEGAYYIRNGIKATLNGPFIRNLPPPLIRTFKGIFDSFATHKVDTKNLRLLIKYQLTIHLLLEELVKDPNSSLRTLFLKRLRHYLDRYKKDPWMGHPSSRADDNIAEHVHQCRLITESLLALLNGSRPSSFCSKDFIEINNAARSKAQKTRRIKEGLETQMNLFHQTWIESTSATTTGSRYGRGFQKALAERREDVLVAISQLLEAKKAVEDRLSSLKEELEIHPVGLNQPTSKIDEAIFDVLRQF